MAASKEGLERRRGGREGGREEAGEPQSISPEGIQPDGVCVCGRVTKKAERVAMQPKRVHTYLPLGAGKSETVMSRNLRPNVAPSTTTTTSLGREGGRKGREGEY